MLAGISWQGLVGANGWLGIQPEKGEGEGGVIAMVCRMQALALQQQTCIALWFIVFRGVPHLLGRSCNGYTKWGSHGLFSY